MDGDFKVVEHTDGVVHGVVAHGFDGYLAETHATHGTFYANRGFGFVAQSTGLIGGFIHDEGHVFKLLAFTHGELAGNQGLHAVVSEIIVSGTVACDIDAWVGTDRHGDELVDHGNLRVALVAANDGVGQAEPREGPALTFVVHRFDG